MASLDQSEWEACAKTNPSKSTPNHMNQTLHQLHARRINFRTRPVDVSVEFAAIAQTIETLEGPVQCQVGDAILTGVVGERWPVSASHFAQKYEPCAGQAIGISGRYQKTIRKVEAVQLDEPIDIQLSDGRGTLHGEPGDWCVWHGENDAAIVRKDIFSASYELAAVPIYVCLGSDLSSEARNQLLELRDQFALHLPNTPVAFIEESANNKSSAPVWFRIVEHLENEPHVIPEILDVPLSTFFDEENQGRNFFSVLHKAKDERPWAFTKSKLRALTAAIIPARDTTKDAASVIIATSQLAAVENFNSNLGKAFSVDQLKYFIEPRDATLEPPGLARIHDIGAIADHLASQQQTRWQQLVLATTKDIANESKKGRLGGLLGLFKFMLRGTLITLGLLAGLGLATFSELSGGCEADDPFAFLGCTSEAWKHGFSPLSFFGVYLLMLLLAWLKYARAKAEQWETRHQDYRLLAECLRVLYVRSILGQASCAGCDLPLGEPTESGWVRAALRSIFHAQAMASRAPLSAPHVSQAQKCFIEHQEKYHKENLLERREYAIALLSSAGRRGFGLFMVALIVLAVHVAAETLLHRAILSPMGLHFALIAQVAGLAFWGAMRKVMDTFALEQEMQRGELVLDALLRAKRSGSADSILAAAQFFLNDQVSWHALHRSKPIEAATGA